MSAASSISLIQAVAKGKDWRKQISAWWKTAPVFDKRWTIGSLIAVVAGLLGLLVYAASKGELVGYLQRAGFHALLLKLTGGEP